MAKNQNRTTQPNPGTLHKHSPRTSLILHPRPAPGGCPRSVSPGAGVRAGRRPRAGLGLDAGEDDATLPQPGAGRDHKTGPAQDHQAPETGLDQLQFGGQVKINSVEPPDLENHDQPLSAFVPYSGLPALNKPAPSVSQRHAAVGGKRSR